jgi:hypothetical protein
LFFLVEDCYQHFLSLVASYAASVAEAFVNESSSAFCRRMETISEMFHHKLKQQHAAKAIIAGTMARVKDESGSGDDGVEEGSGAESLACPHLHFVRLQLLQHRQRTTTARAPETQTQAQKHTEAQAQTQTKAQTQAQTETHAHTQTQQQVIMVDLTAPDVTSSSLPSSLPPALSTVQWPEADLALLAKGLKICKSQLVMGMNEVRTSM